MPTQQLTTSHSTSENPFSLYLPHRLPNHHSLSKTEKSIMSLRSPNRRKHPVHSISNTLYSPRCHDQTGKGKVNQLPPLPMVHTDTTQRNTIRNPRQPRPIKPGSSKCHGTTLYFNLFLVPSRSGTINQCQQRISQSALFRRDLGWMA